MVRTVVRLVCLFTLLSLASAGPSQAQNLVSYDNFNATSLSFDKWIGAELGDDEDAADAGIDAVAQNEVDDAVRTAEIDRGLCPFLGQRIEPFARAAGEHDGQSLIEHWALRESVVARMPGLRLGAVDG